MATPSESNEAPLRSTSSPTPGHIDLKVITQLSDTPFQFTDISLQTTVAELKIMIQNKLPSKPPPATQRLIYSGHVMARDEQKLIEIFKDTAASADAQFSVHLVIRDAAVASQLPPGNPQPHIGAPFVHSMLGPRRMPPPGFVGPPRPASQPNQRSPSPRVLPQATSQGTFLRTGNMNYQAGFPLPIQAQATPESLQGRMDALYRRHAELTQQLLHAHPGQEGQQQPPVQQEMLDHVRRQQIQQALQLAHQQHTAAAAPQERMYPPNTETAITTGDPPASSVNMQQHSSAPAITQSLNTSQSSAPPAVHFGIGPNGERWSSVSQTFSTVPIGPPPQPNAVLHHLVHVMHQIQTELDNRRQEMSEILNMPVDQQPRRYDQVRDQITHTIRHRNLMQHQVNFMLQNGSNPDAGDIGSLQLLNNNFQAQARDMLRELQTRPSERVQPVPIHSQNDATPTPTAALNTSPQNQSSTSQHPATASTFTSPTSTATVYLLSSPQGASALVFTPDGTFQGASINPIRNNNHAEGAIMNPFEHARNRVQHAMAYGHNHQYMHQNLPLGPVQFQQQFRHAPVNAVANPNPPNQQAEPQAPPNPNPNALQAQPNPEANLAQQLMPLLTHFWLLVRLFGFIWFFSAGGGLQHSILLGAATLLFFLFQTGLFNNQILAIRRHFDALLGLHPVEGGANPNPNPNQQPNQNQNPNAPNQNGNENQNQNQPPRRARTPSPATAAARLLRARRARDRTWLRRIERAVALFFATLYPGVGDDFIAAENARRAIAAAEAAEAAAQAQAQAQTQAGAGTGAATGAGAGAGTGTASGADAETGVGGASADPNAQGEAEERGRAMPAATGPTGPTGPAAPGGEVEAVR